MDLKPIKVTLEYDAAAYASLSVAIVNQIAAGLGVPPKIAFAGRRIVGVLYASAQLPELGIRVAQFAGIAWFVRDDGDNSWSRATIPEAATIDLLISRGYLEAVGDIAIETDC